VILSRPTVAWANYPMLRSLAPDAVLIYDTVDLHFVRERRRAAAEGDAGAATRRADYLYGMEMTLVDLADQVWVVSAPEAEVLLEIDPSFDVAVVPTIHREEAAGPPFETREGLLFVGNFAHDPNRDAARWLVEEIVPLVRRELGPVPVALAGSRVTAEIEALAGDGISVLGWVPDLEPIYHRTRVPPDNLTTSLSIVFLLISLVAVVVLAEFLAPGIETGVDKMGAPKSLVGIIIAMVVLLPEGLSALNAARNNQLQSSLNLALGSALASIGLTIPTVAFVALYKGIPLTLGIDTKSTVLFLLSLFIILLSLRTGRTTILQGVVLLIIFAVYIFTTIVP
jgi:Ca2+/H+ antiporter